MKVSPIPKTTNTMYAAAKNVTKDKPYFFIRHLHVLGDRHRDPFLSVHYAGRLIGETAAEEQWSYEIDLVEKLHCFLHRKNPGRKSTES
ncbi:hypothetical protein ACQCUS_15805 [Sutcliffiella horikoshii]